MSWITQKSSYWVSGNYKKEVLWILSLTLSAAKMAARRLRQITQG